MPRKPHEEVLVEELKNPHTAVAYLNAALETGNSSYIQRAINMVMDANGGTHGFHLTDELVEKLRAGLAPAHIRVKFELESA